MLGDQAAAELTALGTRIEVHFGAPQDIEWARAAGEFFIVQSRPITALPLPEADPPTDWSVPDRTAMYVRASIVEQLPDPLTPLFADLIDGSVTRSLQALFTELIGESVIRDSDVDLPTINGYAYYRYSRSGMARLMLNSGGAFKFLLGGGQQGGVGRWRNYAHPRYRAVVERWEANDLDQLSTAELLDGVVELLDAGTEYYTSVQTIIPIAATSEVLFTQFYDRLVRRPGDPAAPTFLLGFDSLPIKAEKSLYDMGTWARSVPGLADDLLATPTERLVAVLHDHDSVVDHPGLTEWRQRFQAHLDAYGHTIYNLDFANAVPADDPAPLIETLRFYLRGEGTDPYRRQQEAVERRERETRAVLERLDAARRKGFLRLLRWAQRVAPIREDALGDVGLAWPRMRQMLFDVGRRLADGGVLTEPDQVYWLRRDEVAQAGSAVEQGLEPPSGLTAVIAERQEVWRGRRRVTPPQLLPDQNWMRIFSSMMPATTAEQGEDRLTGIGASAGRITAAARVLGGPQDFGQMQAGDVLVASITTPAWTPLFALASGVVTDIGGPLSHSSIVAREYGIPAVLGTGVATRRITSGQVITVDGDAGTVALTELDDHEPEIAIATHDRSRTVRTVAIAGGSSPWVHGCVDPAATPPSTCFHVTVRVLFSTTAGAGHFGPMIPVARACMKSGHEVAVAAPESFTAHVRQAGFVHLPFPDVPGRPDGRCLRPSSDAATRGRQPNRRRRSVRTARCPGRLPDVPRDDEVLATRHRGTRSLRVRGLDRRSAAGLPQVQVAIGIDDVMRTFANWLDEPLRELEQIAGLDPIRGAASVRATPTLTSVPAVLDGTGCRATGATTAPVWRYRMTTSAPDQALPATWGDPSVPWSTCHSARSPALRTASTTFIPQSLPRSPTCPSGS